MDWTQVLTVFAIMATNLITVITLYIHSDNKMSAALKSIADEMRDFHGRLERQDAEFKNRLLAIEERTRKEFYKGI